VAASSTPVIGSASDLAGSAFGPGGSAFPAASRCRGAAGTAGLGNCLLFDADYHQVTKAEKPLASLVKQAQDLFLCV
jgi:hypothetical protein